MEDPLFKFYVTSSKSTIILYFQLWHIQIYCLKLTCWSTLKFPIYIYGSGCIVFFKYWLISMSCMPVTSCLYDLVKGLLLLTRHTKA